MKNKLLLLVFVFVLTACGTPPSVTISQETPGDYAKKVAEANAVQLKALEDAADQAQARDLAEREAAAKANAGADNFFMILAVVVLSVGITGGVFAMVLVFLSIQAEKKKKNELLIAKPMSLTTHNNLTLTVIVVKERDDHSYQVVGTFHNIPKYGGYKLPEAVTYALTHSNP